MRSLAFGSLPAWETMFPPRAPFFQGHVELFSAILDLTKREVAREHEPSDRT
jgi:hypothetical protein